MDENRRKEVSLVSPEIVLFVICRSTLCLHSFLRHRTRAHQAAEERGDLKYLLVERQLPFYMLPGEERRYMYTSVTVFSPSMSLDMQYMRKQD